MGHSRGAVSHHLKNHVSPVQVRLFTVTKDDVALRSAGWGMPVRPPSDIQRVTV